MAVTIKARVLPWVQLVNCSQPLLNNRQKFIPMEMSNLNDK